MTKNLKTLARLLPFALLLGLALCATCWAGPPAPPLAGGGAVVPVTPVGNVGMSALTVIALAGYGFWKSRR